MGNDQVHRPLGVGLGRGVGPAQEEDLSGELLAHLSGQVGAAESAVETRDVGVGLFEAGVFGAGDRQVTDHVERMTRRRQPSPVRRR